MKQKWQKPIIQIIGIQTNAQDVLTASLESTSELKDVGLDFTSEWGEIYGVEIE